MKGSDAKCPAEVEKKEPSSATIKPKDEDGTVFTCLVFNLNVQSIRVFVDRVFVDIRVFVDTFLAF